MDRRVEQFASRTSLTSLTLEDFPMNKLLVLMAACALAAAAPAFAADTAAAPNAQQEKMKACNAKAQEVHEQLPVGKTRPGGQARKQDLHVQQADGGDVRRCAFEGAVRVHEGAGCRACRCRGARQVGSTRNPDFVVASDGFHVKSRSY
jgi:hypothetical protein